MTRTALPQEVVSLRLARIVGEDLRLCEGVRFERGAAAAEMVLRRAAIAGRVEVDGEVGNHFADAMDDNGDIVAVVALDRGSYASLKNHWMRCKVAA